jgi:hypothetical protein
MTGGAYQPAGLSQQQQQQQQAYRATSPFGNGSHGSLMALRVHRLLRHWGAK